MPPSLILDAAIRRVQTSSDLVTRQMPPCRVPDRSRLEVDLVVTRSIDVVIQRWARLVSGWVTVFGRVNHPGAEPGTQAYSA